MCSEIVLKCSNLARIGRPNILWSVNKLARAVTKCTMACDKRLARSISYIHNPSGHSRYCNVGHTANQCRPGLFQDSEFAGDLEDSKSSSGGVLCVVGSPNKLQFYTVPLMQFCVWTAFPRLTHGIWSLKCCTHHHNNLKARGDQLREHTVRHVPVEER